MYKPVFVWTRAYWPLPVGGQSDSLLPLCFGMLSHMSKVGIYENSSPPWCKAEHLEHSLWLLYGSMSQEWQILGCHSPSGWSRHNSQTKRKKQKWKHTNKQKQLTLLRRKLRNKHGHASTRKTQRRQIYTCKMPRATFACTEPIKTMADFETHWKRYYMHSAMDPPDSLQPYQD